MSNTKKLSVSIFAALIFFSSVAQAASITWTINGPITIVTGDLRAVITGSFDFDADTNSFSNVSLSLVDDSFPGTIYDISNAWSAVTAGSDSSSIATNATAPAGSYWDSSNIDLFLFAPLTNAGGNIITSASVFVDGTKRPGVGYGSISAVPVPTAVWLFGSALAGLGWFGRRQAR